MCGDSMVLAQLAWPPWLSGTFSYEIAAIHNLKHRFVSVPISTQFISANEQTASGGRFQRPMR